MRQTATVREGVLPENHPMAPFHLSGVSRNEGRQTFVSENGPLRRDAATSPRPSSPSSVQLSRSGPGPQVPDSRGGRRDTASCGTQLQRPEHHGRHLHPLPAQEHWFVSSPRYNSVCLCKPAAVPFLTVSSSGGSETFQDKVNFFQRELRHIHSKRPRTKTCLKITRHTILDSVSAALRRRKSAHPKKCPLPPPPRS